jgi:YidC/Oxa1 family membrane protein insertase
MFPLVIKAQKNSAKLNNNMPTMTRLQERFTEARQSGNPLEGRSARREEIEFELGRAVVHRQCRICLRRCKK